MKKFAMVISLFIILPVIVRPAHAFLKEDDQTLVVDTLNELQLEGYFDQQGAVSFDSVRCARSSRSCLVEFRTVDRADEFGAIRSAKCIIEGIHSRHDIFNEDEKNKKNNYFPLTKYFAQAVQNCQGVLEVEAED